MPNINLLRELGHKKWMERKEAEDAAFAEDNRIKAETLLSSDRPDKGWRVKRTLHPYSYRERIFAQRWMDECDPEKNAFEPRTGIVQALFIELNDYNWLFRIKKVVAVLTRRERMVVATVIQWLGSNVGWNFLETTLKECGYTIIRTEDLEKVKLNAKV